MGRSEAERQTHRQTDISYTPLSLSFRHRQKGSKCPERKRASQCYVLKGGFLSQCTPQKGNRLPLRKNSRTQSCFLFPTAELFPTCGGGKLYRGNLPTLQSCLPSLPCSADQREPAGQKSLREGVAWGEACWLHPAHGLEDALAHLAACSSSHA